MEVNIDSLVGPTHFFGGLSKGNIASQKSQDHVSHPKQAALEGLEKMKRLHDLGLKQLIFPPHERPFLNGNSEKEKLKALEVLIKEHPKKLPLIYSSSSMWTANAATISSHFDSKDKKSHITPANLSYFPHRAIETEITGQLLKLCFNNKARYHHHPAIDSKFSDEGAANHFRLCPNYEEEGLNVYVHGNNKTARFPSRQSKEACEKIIESHQVKNNLLLEQSQKAIQAGIFHNDVICLSNLSLLITHENAFEDKNAISLIQKGYEKENKNLDILVATEKEFPLKDCVESYFFNSQLVTAPNKQILILPQSVQKNAPAMRFLNNALNKRMIQDCHFIPLSESLKNGGGPACCRLRVILSQKDWEEIPKSFKFSKNSYQRLKKIIQSEYPESITQAQFSNPELMERSFKVLEKISREFELKHFYSFKKQNYC